MNEKIFRKTALDRLSSPEQLDQIMQVASPRTRLMLAAFGILFAALVAWSLLGTTYVEVGAQGILVADGTFDVEASGPGRLVDILVRPGDTVKQGQSVARIQTADGAMVDLSSELEGTVFEILALRGIQVEMGTAIASIEASGDLKAAIFVPTRKVGQILPGMQVYLSPATAPPERGGYLVGEVASVTPHPATERGLMVLFGNDRLVESLLSVGPISRVDVVLVRDPSTPGNYVWSSPQSQSLPLAGGTPCTARIRLAARRPASLLVSSFN